MSKKNTLLYLDEFLVKMAKQMGINISEVSEAALKSRIKPLLSLGEQVAFDFKEHLETLEKLGECFFLPFEIKRISLKNIGPLKNFSAEFSRFNIITGSCGSGKSIIIRCIAHFAGHGVLKKNIVTHGEKSGAIILKIKPEDTLKAEFIMSTKESFIRNCKSILIDGGGDCLDKKNFNKFLDYLKKLDKQIILTCANPDLNMVSKDKLVRIIKLKK